MLCAQTPGWDFGSRVGILGARLGFWEPGWDFGSRAGISGAKRRARSRLPSGFSLTGSRDSPAEPPPGLGSGRGCGHPSAGGPAVPLSFLVPALKTPLRRRGEQEERGERAAAPQSYLQVSLREPTHSSTPSAANSSLSCSSGTEQNLRSCRDSGKGQKAGEDPAQRNKPDAWSHFLKFTTRGKPRVSGGGGRTLEVV